MKIYGYRQGASHSYCLFTQIPGVGEGISRRIMNFIGARRKVFMK
jgi:hypothetical protein